MTRTDATKLLRQVLDANGLSAWHLRLTTDLTKPFLGMCMPKDKCIILNAHHIDTHPDAEIENTILHEVAHALTVGHGHDDVWATKARELGCSNTLPCSTYGFSPAAIDAIRSGADLLVSFEEQTIRTPKYTITRLQDKCPTCGKVAKTLSEKEVDTKLGRKRVITLECKHIIIKDADSVSPFEKITFDGDSNCKHEWNKTVCIKCDAKKLYPFQIEGARSLERANGRLAIFDEMGLGKTIQALAYLKYHKEDAWPFLWVTKAGTIYQHAKEIVRVLGKNAFPQVIRTGRDTPINGFNLIASYDIFRRLDLEEFKKHGIKTIILDECQAIKNPDSARTQCVRKIAKEVPNIIPLSGTFWKNRGSEAFVTCNLLDPKMFWSYESFRRNEVSYYYDGYKEKEGGLRKGFMDKIKHIAIRRERTQVMPELPLINRTRIVCEVPKHAREVYEQEEAALIKDYNDAVMGGEENSLINQASMMHHLMVMRQIVGIAKVPSTLEYAQEFMEETDRKLAIFVHHIQCGEMIYEEMKKWCAENDCPEPLQLSASMDSALRNEVAEKFNSPHYRLLVASTLASGEGLNLQTCSDCIMHERQWNPANEEQAEGRFIRIGQTANSVNAIYVHGDDTVDTHLNEIVERKRVNFHASMNKGEMPTWNQNDVIKQLVESIASKKKQRKVS